MNLKPRKLWSALATAALGVVVNLATELKHNLLAWIAVPVLAILVAELESMVDQGRQRRVLRSQEQALPPVLHYEERNGTAHRTMSTTSEKVATEFLKRVSLPLDTPPKSVKPKLK